jgi:hypothetical protein
MSAAATAAGYLYASGRLRAKKEEAAEKAEKGERVERKAHHPAPHSHAEGQPRRPIKVAVYQRAEEQPAASAPSAPRKQPKIEYRTRRWKPE